MDWMLEDFLYPRPAIRITGDDNSKVNRTNDDNVQATHNNEPQEQVEPFVVSLAYAIADPDKY